MTSTEPLPPVPRRMRRWLVLLAAFALVVVGYVYRIEWLRGWGEYVNAPSPTINAEVGFILGGGRSTRADQAATLFKQGKIKRILVGGAGEPADVDGVRLLSEQQLLVGMLEKLGVPKSKLDLLPDECFSTQDEAFALGRYLDEHPVRSVVIITSDYHTRRCRVFFEHALADRDVELQYAGAPTTTVDPNHWWKDSRGGSIYGLEMIKMIFAWARTLW